MKYDDIIDRERPISTRHRPMPLEKRAAQFAPFAALTGYEALAGEAARLTEDRRELSEDGKAVLDELLKQLMLLSKHPPVSIEYYVEDKKKSGGAYHTVSGTIKKVDIEQKVITLMDGTKISISNVTSIQTPLLPDVMG